VRALIGFLSWPIRFEVPVSTLNLPDDHLSPYILGRLKLSPNLSRCRNSAACSCGFRSYENSDLCSYSPAPHFTFAWLEFPDESRASMGAVKNQALTAASTTAPPYIHNSSPTGLISGSAPTFGKDSPTNSIPNCFAGFIGSRDGYPPSFWRPREPAVSQSMRCS